MQDDEAVALSEERVTPREQDTLITALRIQERAADVGFDWPDASGPRAKVEEELKELDRETRKGKRETIEDEIGDVLFAVVNLARKLKIDPRAALEQANTKFQRRFDAVQRLARRCGSSPGPRRVRSSTALAPAAPARRAHPTKRPR